MKSHKKDYSYILYIDESGDTGRKNIRPDVPTGSSEWLILSGILVRVEDEAKVLPWVKTIVSKLPKHQNNSIHFQKVADRKKRIICTEVSKLKLKAFCVISNKRNIQNYSNTFAQKTAGRHQPKGQWLYFWLLRLLLESASDYAYRDTVKNRNGFIKPLRVELSKKGGLNYDHFHEYFERLRQQSQKNSLFQNSKSLKAEMMDSEQIHIYPAETRAGLQLADIIAGSFFKACDKFHTNNLDNEFAKLLRPVLAQDDRGRIPYYGLKLMPKFKDLKTHEDQKEIFRYYGFR